jgi:hypothetical protein
MFGASWEAIAQDTKIPYPSMAPLEHHLMPDRNEEIKLARNAALYSISGHAEVLVKCNKSAMGRSPELRFS